MLDPVDGAYRRQMNRQLTIHQAYRDDMDDQLGVRGWRGGPPAFASATGGGRGGRADRGVVQAQVQVTATVWTAARCVDADHRPRSRWAATRTRVPQRVEQ
ncbi:hypothetical protein AB0C59_33815 [Streptomyces sp. NPDC048664]|uniref:hypothetical protein n=1 Tax=Streptomyces sp. NPDC048664 TaxID=3154505 RepID=UPI0034488E77